VDGGRCLFWRGKMGLIGGVTQALDSHHAVMAEMGPRFVLYRLPPVDARLQARRALSSSGREAETRLKLRGEVQSFFSGLNLAPHDGSNGSQRAQSTTEDTTRLVLLVEFASRCRSAVERHPYSREITQIFEPEAPARLVRSAAQLLSGLEVIGIPPERRRQLVAQVLLDCIPPVRRAVLDYLTNCKADDGAALLISLVCQGRRCAPHSKILSVMAWLNRVRTDGRSRKRGLRIFASRIRALGADPQGLAGGELAQAVIRIHETRKVRKLCRSKNPKSQ
jgi:hypothetical protein